MPEISVVIPTYDRLETLRHVIPSLLKQTLAAERYEVLVADSNSGDGTAEYLREVALTAPGVRHLPGPYTGRAMARNAGIAAAAAPLVLFTDADIIAAPDLLERHLERHGAESGIAVVGLELQVSSYEDYVAQASEAARRRPLHPAGRKKLSWLYFLTGNASVRRADLERVGRFDESFTGYGHEDLELGYRLARAGIVLRYEPRAINYHWHPVPYEEQRGRMELAGRSTVRFFKKHPTFAVKALLGMTPLSLGLHRLLRSLPVLVAWLERAGKDNALARNLIYQYHYVSGIKAALNERKT